MRGSGSLQTFPSRLEPTHVEISWYCTAISSADDLVLGLASSDDEGLW